MSAELRKLAKQFESSGSNDIATDLTALAEIADRRGLDTFQTSTTEIEASVAQKFSKEQREALEKQGFRIYELTGQSILTLKGQGRTFNTGDHNYLNFPKLETLASRRSEVAINPLMVFLPKSNNKDPKQQLALVAELSSYISEKVPGTEAVVGNVADYAELFFAHLDKTGKYLFSTENHSRARTTTFADPQQNDLIKDRNIPVEVGITRPRISFFVGLDPQHERSDIIYVAPLIVPSGVK